MTLFFSNSASANSAGQAAVNLALYAQKVTIVVRAASLAARMSQYLIDQISATPNIDVRATTQIAAAAGTGKLEALTLQDTKTGSIQTVPASALVVLIGAVPHTDWLPPHVGRDARGSSRPEATFPLTATPRPGGPCRVRRSR
jgi:thioredoxin reductase (NADPH)